jgi:hypothetical protein
VPLVPLAVSACAGGTSTATPLPEARLAIKPLGAAIVGVTRMSFEGSASGAAAAAQFRWEFGDGDAALGASVEHVYRSPGVFRVVLTVDSTGGAVSVVGSVEARLLSGSWYSPRTSSPFTPPGVGIDMPLTLVQVGERLEGEVPSFAWCPLDRDAAGRLRFARVTGEVRHPRNVAFRWACGSFRGVADPWLDSLTSETGATLYYRR